jgi:DNA repair photolyase
MPIEEKTEITRRLLEIILKHRFPVEIGTKSTLVLRDLDLLKQIDEKAILPEELKPKLKHGTIISFSPSTLDEKLAKIFEPGAPSPNVRLETMKKCKEQGFLVGVDYIPVLPFLSDSDEQLDEMITTARDYGADFALVGALTLFGKGPADCKTLYYRVLEKYYPQLVPKYKSLFRVFPMPSKEYQSELEQKSVQLCQKHGVKHSII